MSLSHYKIHRFCALFPKPDAEQYAAMKASIVAKGGLVDPVVMWCGEVVEGKTRLEICEETGVDPGVFRQWTSSARAITIEQQEAELWEWIKAKNIDRRHMTSAQIAAVLVDHAKLMGRGQPSKSNLSTGEITVSSATIAKEAKQSVATVNRIVAVKKQADPKVFDAVKQGKATPRDAEIVSREPVKVQRQAVKDVESGTTKTLKESVEKQKPKIEPIETKLGDWPKPVAEAMAAIETFDKLIASLGRIEGEVKRLLDAKPGGHLGQTDIENLLKNAKSALRTCKPVCPCPNCKGKGCKSCKDSGWWCDQQRRQLETAAHKLWLAERGF